MLLVLVGCSDLNSSQTSSDPLIREHELRIPEELRYELTNDLGEKIGLGIFESELNSVDLSEIVLQERYSRAGNESISDTITTRVSASDFLGLGGTRKVEPTEQFKIEAISYTWEIAEDDLGKPILHKTDNLAGQKSPNKKKLPDMEIYANSSSFWLWRQLPLALGYTTSYVAVDPFEEKWQMVIISVPQSEILQTSFGEIPVWRVLIRSGRATRSAWIEQSAPYRVLKWDNGQTVMTLVD